MILDRISRHEGTKTRRKEMKNEEWRMKNGEAKAKFGIVFLKWKLFLLFPFFIVHSPFLTLGAFVSSWQEQREKYGPVTE